MGIIKIFLSILLNVCMTFYACGADTQNGYTAVEKKIYATSVGMMSGGGGKIASAVASDRADRNADVDMRQFQSTMNCVYSSQYPRISYGETHTIPKTDDRFFDIRNSYIELVGRLNILRGELGISPILDIETNIDNKDLYKVVSAEPNYQMATAEQRIKTNNSSNDIKTGIAMIASAIAVTDIKNAVDSKNSNVQATNVPSKAEKSAPNDGISSVVETKNSIDNNVSMVAPTQQDSKQDDASTQDANNRGEVDELCEEFPDEPECKE